jgi:hypothetical protein
MQTFLTGRRARVVLAHGPDDARDQRADRLTKGQAHTLMDDAKARFGKE